jgi:acyl-coenzyme A synthetase/AMP-(fatty) acid ligase/thioesterase domain-containing protein/acyl carrier protein
LGRPVLNIDDLRPDNNSFYENPKLNIQPGEPAYIIYTSGSSGEPKGVVQTHRNVLFDIRRQGIDLKTTLDDRYGLLFASSSSASVCHIFGALLNGAAVFPFDIREQGFKRLTQWLASEEITILDINVAIFRQWCETFEKQNQLLSQTQSQFPKLRLLAPGSEPVYARDVELYRRYFSPECLMQNALGTTETRTVTQYYLTHTTPLEGSLVPVGQAIEGKEVLLLDSSHQEVGAGEIGEIAVRSRYLSPGYWQQPELTAAVFQTDPHDSELRTYFTGDLGRFNKEGQLIHLGRKDFQVKIRGYRVEIAEVEMALFKTTGLAAAAAAFEDHSGNQQLAAYLVVNRENIPSIRDLRTALLQQLPDYAVPTRFEFLNALPTTLNGKLDRKALPVPQSNPINNREAFEEPIGHCEPRLARLYEEVLAVEPVGATDDFFDLGGHSLLATQLMLRIEDEFAQQLPISAVVKAPTVRELSALLDQNATGTRRNCLVQIQADQESKKTPLFCLHGNGGNALQFHRFASYLPADQPVYGFDPLGLEGDIRPHATIEQMSAHYLVEIKSVQPTGPYFLCGFSMGGLIAFDIACNLRQAGEEVGLMALFDTDFPGVHEEQIRLGWRARIALRSRLRRRLCQLQYHWHLLRRQGAPPALATEYIQNQHLAAASRYHPQEYAGRITYFRAEGRQDRRPLPHRDGGWGRVRHAEIETYDIRGNHGLIQEPYVGELARLMQLCLEKAQQRCNT